MDDSALAVAMAVKDPQALDVAYRRYAGRLYAYARTLVGDAESAADVVQDTFMLASEHAGQLRDPSRLRPWLYSIARHEGLRQLRQRGRQVPLEVADDVAADSVEPTAQVHQSQLAQLVRAACDGLSDGDRHVAELAFRHGLAADEIANVLGVSVKHAHARLSRARAQLSISLGVLLVVRSGAGCPELAELVRGWDGHLTPLLRKRLHRHIDACRTCNGVRDQRFNPVALLSAYAALPFLAGAEALGANPATASTLALAANSATGADSATSADAATSADPATTAFPGTAARSSVPTPRFDRSGFPKPPGHRPVAASVVAVAAAAAVTLALCAGLAVIDPFGQPAGAPLGAGPGASGSSAAMGTAEPDPGLGNPSPTEKPSPTPSVRPSESARPGVDGSPTPTVAPLIVTTRFSVICDGAYFKLRVTAAANAPLASGTLYWRPLVTRRSAAMTVAGESATGVSGTIRTSKITWYVMVTAVDGRTTRTPEAQLANPCQPAG